MKIAITGASGLLGTAVSAALRERGDAVTRMVRSREAAAAGDAIFWDPATRSVDAAGLAGHDAVINLAGENIAGLWTAAKKQRIRDSRVGGTRLLAETLAALPADRRPAVLVNASGISYFGDRPRDQPMTEASPPGEGFMAELVQDWEAAADPAREAGLRVVHLRFGPVLDRDALLLQATATATRVGLGAVLGDGSQPFPWTTRDEVVRLVLFALDRPDIEGRVNAAAPERTTNRSYADTLARVLGRPRVLRIPALAVRLIGPLGQEMLRGAWVLPAKLDAAGYEWLDPRLEPALRRLLGKP